MKLIYRFEDIHGKGIYKVGNKASIAVRSDYDSYRHPGPYEDSKLKPHWEAVKQPDFRFGFASMDQLKAWFYNDETVITAYDEGVCVSVYAVPDVACHIGNAQAIFHSVYHTPADKLRVLTLDEVLAGVDKALEDVQNGVLSSIHHVKWNRKNDHV